MSTWHQRKAGIPPLFHPELYTVVSDPPDELLSVTRFKDAVDAEHLKTNLQAAWVQARMKLSEVGHDQAVVSEAFKRDAAVIFYVIPPQR